jgi:very-short-patch-repair endonuclease
MRNVPTDAERKLWGRLRSKQLAGVRFRRQQPIGPYIADFFCSAVKLIVELDGGQHGADLQEEYDTARTRLLTMRGYRVMRFANEDFLREPDVVMEAIGRAITERAAALER